jgi:hypothetical protein
LILLAFLLPFSIYLLLLGNLNRRSRPVLVPGTWDFAGLLFAASGFLLVVGPAVISSGSESWRMFWLFGARAGVPAVDEGAARFWSFLATLYFGVVVGGAAYLFRRWRSLTAVYNIEPEVLEKVLAQVFGALGLNPLRSGNLFVFGAGSAFAATRREPVAIQAPHHFPSRATPTAADGIGTAETDLIGEAAVLEVEPFALLRHVTLRWEPDGTLLRREVEAELERTLAQTPTAANPAGDWLTMIALALIAFNLLATFGMTASNFLRR